MVNEIVYGTGNDILAFAASLEQHCEGAAPALRGDIFFNSSLTKPPLGTRTLRVPLDYPTIQGAIAASMDGDTVLVAPGTYIENISFLGNHITVTSEGGPAVTMIDGNLADSAVTFISGEGPTSVLHGFTLQNGRPNGIGVENGGGIQIRYSSPTITGNMITNDQACEGGGICSYFGSPMIQGGGGIYLGGTHAALINNTIVDNDAQQGSGIFTDVAVGGWTAISNLFVGKPEQSAIFCTNLFSGEVAMFASNDVFSPQGSAWGAECVDLTGIHGNISADPLFVNPSSGDYHLRLGSPAMDAGDNTAPNLPSTDLDRHPRILAGNCDTNTVVDMGAYEFTPSNGPELGLSVNTTEVGAGDQLTLAAITCPGLTPVTADAYVAIQPPASMAANRRGSTHGWQRSQSPIR